MNKSDKERFRELRSWAADCEGDPEDVENVEWLITQLRRLDKRCEQMQEFIKWADCLCASKHICARCKALEVADE